jgi:hypothetical protein
MGRTLHFVGFRGDEYTRAVRVWGVPDFVHRIWDQRAHAETRWDEGAVVVFARAKDWERKDSPAPFSFDDSAVM